MNIPCPVCNPCDELTPPYINLTSEGLDHDHCFGVGYWPYDPPISGDPCLEWWCQGQCKTEVINGVCDNPEYCATNQSLECDHDNCGDGGGGGGDNKPPPGNIRIFYNRRQTCTVDCPDGTHFTYVVRAGLLANTSQIIADRAAHSLACQQAARNRICLSNLPEACCQDRPFFAIITATTINDINTWNIDPGLPPGLHAITQSHRSLAISGTPTSDGPFDFDITAIDASGNHLTKHYSLCVVKITPDSGVMPDATIGTAYNEPLNETLCTPLPKQWTVVSGSLPAGLTMDLATGLIHGTPTGPAGTVTFTVQLQAG